jgi:hypothetical protein
MVDSVRMLDFIDSQDNIDWKKYRDAQINNGERCSQCKAYIAIPQGYPTTCSSCRQLDDSNSVNHHAYVRCPACHRHWCPGDYEDYDILGDGEHDVRCVHCEHKFQISTHISWTFESPPLEPN